MIISMMDDVIPGERCSRDFRGKFPDDVPPVIHPQNLVVANQVFSKELINVLI